MDDAQLTEVLLAALDAVPTFEYRADGGNFAAESVGVVYGRLPANHDRAIGLRVYGGDDDEVGALHSRRVQVRLRGRPYLVDDADKLGHPVYLVLTGLSRLGGISGCARVSFAPMGADANGREERVENYEVTLDNEGAQS